MQNLVGCGWRGKRLVPKKLAPDLAAAGVTFAAWKQVLAELS